MKERIKIPKGNDAVFCLYLYAKAQGVYGHIGEELIKVDRNPIILSKVENLSVRLISLFSKQESILPVTIASDETIPNRLQVEFPKELQGEGEYDVIVDFDIPNPSISDKLLHRSTRIPFVCIIPNKNNLDGFSDNINIVIDVMPAIIGEKGEQGERGQDGINGTNGENGRDGRDGVDGRNGRDGENGKSALELLNEENGTEHSSITDALKTLMPKESSESKIYERVMANSIYTIIRNILQDSNPEQALMDPFYSFYEKVLKGYNIKKLQKISSDYREETFFRPIIDTTPLFMDTEKNNDYDLQPFVTLVEYAFHYNGEMGDKPAPIPVLPFSDFTGVMHELKEDLAFDIIVSLPFVDKLDDKATFYIKIQDPDHTIYNKLKSIEKSIYDASSYSYHNYIDVDLIIDEDLSSYNFEEKIGNIVFKSRD